MGASFSSIMNFVWDNAVIIATGAIAVFLVTGTNADTQYEHGTPSIHIACWFRSTYPLNTLIASGADVNAVNRDGSTALHEACWRRLPSYIFNALIAASADVNVQDNNGYTPLYIACIYYCSPDYMKLLIKAGADVNVPDNEGWTPLHLMCHREIDSVDKIKLPLASGANVDAQTVTGQSSLHFACSVGDMRVVQILLDAGADPLIKNNNNELPHEVTFKKEIKELLEHFGGGRATKTATPFK